MIGIAGGRYIFDDPAAVLFLSGVAARAALLRELFEGAPGIESVSGLGLMLGLKPSGLQAMSSPPAWKTAFSFSPPRIRCGCCPP